MQVILLIATACAVAFDPIPKSEALPPIKDEMWKQSADRLKQIAIAIHNYHDVNGSMPQNIFDGKGKRLLSWRVQLLPFLDANELYKQFKLGESWDSEHNRKLIEKMPKVFQPVRFKAEAGHTLYQGFVGEGTIFREGNPVRFNDITDGMSNTALVATASKPVPWTKPEDIPFDVKKDLPKLGAEFDGDFNLLMADGSVKKIKKTFNARTLMHVIQMNDGNVIHFDTVEK